MPKFVTIPKALEGAEQLEGDIQRVLSDTEDISAIEKKIYNTVPVTNVSVEEIQARFDSLMEDEVYPQYPFSISTLTPENLVGLGDIDVGHDDTMAIIELIPIKQPQDAE